MTSQANNRNGGMLITRNERSMPKWVSEQSDRIGPRPPPPPSTPENGQILTKEPSLPPKTKQPEPDYEVIEFSNQQYSNAPIRPNSASSGSKTPDNKLKCTLCGSGNPWVTCEECAQQIFCASCDDMFHKHPKRKNHQRKTIEKSRPPLPPKVLPGQSGPTPPVAPPRRNKRGLMTPIMQRKDQGNAMPGSFPVPSSPTPSVKNSSWQERFGSLPRGLNLLNRPLPETPKTPSESSRSTTPKSVFDNIQRPPSVALEKIKSKANATLDRMQVLQQRYRQQKEQMERERSGSVTDQNLSAFDQWSSISQSPSHFRSGSMSSGINSSHLDLTDDNNFNLFHQRQMALQHHQIAAQRANHLGQRGMSSSVFNLSHMNRKQPMSNNGWMNSHLQQAQSVAQLNCSNCAQHQPQWNGTTQHHMHMSQDPWSNQLTSQQHLNRSNMSLNVSAGYMMQPQMNGMYPPPTFMNQRNLMQQMYPQPYIGGMPIMNPGLMAMPPSTSRAGSRMASPAMSRKSVTLRRKQRSSYIDDEATDDEDSDEDDHRSITSTRSGVSRSRQRRMSSASQIQPDDDIDSSQVKLNRNRARNQRRDSVAKSVHNDWAPGRRTSSSNNNRSADSGFNSPLKPSRIYSDLDSEGSGTRALVQAKIEQKLKEESLKQKQSKPKRQSQSPTPQKTSSAVQTPPVKHSSKSEKVENPIEEFAKQPKAPSESEAENVVQQNKKEESRVFEEKHATKEEEEDRENSESASEQSHESESLNENEQTQHIEENEIEEDDLGPPPSTPDHEWECEFCTFVNEANIKICTICCKTPSIKPKKVLKSISPPKQTKITTIEKDKETTKESKPVKIKSGTIKKTFLTSSSQPSTIQNTIIHNTESLQTTKTDSAHNTEDRIESAANTQKNKESVEDIWAALDENIQNTAHEVTRKAESKNPAKISTACGNFSGSASVELRDNDSSKSQAREIGTSPPPQSISTQTYDTLLPPKSEIRKETVVKPPSQPMYNDIIQHTNFPSSPKIQDLKSFEAEVLNNIHNISHVPSHCHNHHANHHPMYSHNDRQRYRSNNDLRMDDTMSLDFEAFNGLGRRQPSISELMLLQKTSSQMHSPFGGSIYDLPYRELSSVRPNDMENHKESDIYKHTTEELNAALKYCGPDMHPLVWLRDNWPKLIQTVQSLATKYGQERAENTIGTISQMEAREALRMHTGNIWQAVSECIEQRQRKYREIFAKGNFSREDIVTALTTHQGNVELALMDLGRSQLKPFLMRIWGSPGGVENESGSLPSPDTTHSSQSTHYNINKEIHNFLSANASECMQKPNATGAFSLNNQMPSPFDRPVSSNSPFDSNNHMLDNTSSYSADSKDFAYSPNSLPLDESILSNKNVLKDLETLIGNIEHNQQNQNEQVIPSVNDMNINVKPKPENEYDSESMRILTKSPISSPKLKTTPKESNLKNEADVKNFVWQHIQEIVPNLVHQVEMELMDDIEQKLKNNEGLEEKRETTPELKQTAPPPPPPPPPIDQDEFLMEEVIKPNIRNALIREELSPHYVYTAEIATFQMAFDRCLERTHIEEFELETLEDASRQVYKMFRAPEVQMVQEDENIMNQIIETTHEVKIDLTETPVQNLISSIPQTDSLNAEVPISLQAQLEVLQTQLQEAISSEPQFEYTKAEVPVTFGAQSDLMQAEIKKANLSDFQHGSSNIELSAFLDTQSEVQIDKEIPTTSKNNIELEVIKTENVKTLDEVNIDKDVMKTITFETPNELLEFNKEIQPSTNISLQVSSETKVEKLTDEFSESSVITIRLGETNTQTAYDEIPSTSQWKYNIKKENLSEVHTNTKATNNEILNQKYQQTNVDPSVVRISSINSIPETTSTNEPGKTFRESPVEKEEDANLAPQITKPNKYSKIQTKIMNLQKRTTVKDLEQAKAEANIKNVGHHDEIVPIASENDFKKPEVVGKDYNSPKNQRQPDESNKNMNNNDSQNLSISVQISENTSSTSQTSTNSNKPFSTLKTNVTSNETLPSVLNRISKIPVRRTFSNKSLINNSSTLTKTSSNKDLKSPDFNLPINTREIEIPKSRFEVESPNSLFTEDESEEELNGIESESSTTNVTSRAEQLQSPSTAREMFLVIQQEGSENTSSVAPSTSSSTLHSTISQSSGLKSPTEFIPSGDPTKQNLTELVEDTQRLIKQMKDEISIDDFESSTDDDDYSEEYSDEYDDGADEEEEEEEWEEEEEENEDDEEYDDLTEEITEENELFSVEGDSLSQPQSPPPSQETQDPREIRNSSALSNITESSDHSQALLSDHFEQDELTTKKSNDTHNELYSFEAGFLSKPQSPPPSQESHDSREIRNSSALSNITESSAHSPALLSDHFEQDELMTKKSNDTHNELYSFEADSLSKPQSPPPSQESQDPNELRNSSALSNITESSDHSPALLSDHFEQDELTTKKSNVTQNKNDNVEDTAAFAETENSLPDLPVETLLENNFDNSQSFMELVELPKSLPETSVETVLSSVKTQDHSNAQTYSKDKTALVSGLKDILSARNSISNELESENSIPELPVEIVYTNSATQQANDDSTLTNNKDLEDVDKLEDSQKSIKILQTENDLPTFSKKQLPTGPKESMIDANQPSTSKQNATIDPSKMIKESISPSQVETESLNSNVETDITNVSANDSLTTKEDLPTTSTSKKLSLTSVQNTQQRKSESNAANVTSSSKGTKSLENKKKSNNETKTPVKKSPAASKIPKPKETPKEPKPKVTPTTKSQNEFKKKLYTRSKSFSGPPTPIGIASVKTISQKFISPNPNTKQLTTPKNYSTVPRKSSIVEAINKLNKPLTSTENPAICAIFKSRTQPRIPKKKYHETCFSDDDYESSTSEEEIETLEVRQRKLSVPVFRAYPSVQEPEEVTTEDLVQKFMREELTTTIAEAQIAAALVSMKFQQDVSIWAAKECSDLDHAIALLKQECELCSGTYALNQIVSMLKCTHKCCKQCVKTYFTVQITERSINDCSCPFCKLPELHSQTEHEDDYLEYFSNLDIFLKNILEPDVHELFQRKLRDRTLLKDPNFKWCVQCSSGFFARPKQKRLICPDCGSVTCAQCRKTWKKQHEGISCDQYSEWESANDPEVQAKGVKQHLEQNGIDCPKCKFRYSLTRGGCMHFTCTQCKYEFCYGCAKPFMMGAKCTISPYCAKLGLHAHHPRNCLFYLRDKLPVQLQILLKNNNESFEVDPIEVTDSENDNEPSSSKKKEQLCPIPIQKETPTGLVDTKCNGDVPEKHAGMCRTHYVEYLTAKVAKAKIDPLPIFDLTDCVQELRRRGIALPERGPWDTDEIYKNMCIEVIQKNIPLDIMD